MWRKLLAGVILSCVVCSTSAAEDHFLIIGGGSQPANNQIAIERNTGFFLTVMKEIGLGRSPCDVFFSAGQSDSKVVRYRQDLSETQDLLARLLIDNEGGREKLADRAIDLEGVEGPATRASLRKYFARVGPALHKGDRLIIYFSGHGTHGDKRTPRNTGLTLWKEPPLRVTELTAMLDQLPRDSHVVLVMVQCFAGGFADVMFDHGKAGADLSDDDRCGFFAAVSDRTAAGCTPEVNESSFKDYSTYFLAALAGKTRDGHPVPMADVDYDRDGKISMAEAHAYVLIHADTTDLPTCTSDVFLRQFSATSSAAHPDLLSSSTPLAKLAALASPSRRAVLVQLSAKLKLKGDDLVAEVRRMNYAENAQQKQVTRQRQTASDQLRDVHRMIRDDLVRRWPQLSPLRPWTLPSVLELSARSDAAAIVAALRAHASFGRWLALAKQIDGDDATLNDLYLERIKGERLLYVAHSVALAANLPKVADRKRVERYLQLVKDEDGVLGATRLAATQPAK